MPRDNSEIVRRFADGLAQGDRDATAELIHPDAEWHTMAGPILGVEAVRGRNEVISFLFDRIPEGFEDFTATVDGIRELPDDRLLVLGHYAGRGRSSGAVMEMTSAAIYRFEAGMIVSFHDFASEAEALRAARVSN
jgi:ketosteroid isomerase-like protein